MFKKYEFQRKKSPLSEKSNSVASATVLKGDCNGNQKLNGVFESKDGGFANSSPITIDSSSDSDDEDISELLKSVIYEHSEDSSSSKSKKSTQVYKNTSRSSPSAQKEYSEHCNNEMTGKVDGKEMRKDILKTLNEVFPNANKELIKYAAQEGENLNEACNIVSESMKEESPIVKATKQKRKRVKPIEDSDSDACLTPKKKQRNSTEKQALNDSCSVSNGNIKDSIDPENENFKKLKEMFTSRSNSDIKAALELTNHLAEARIFLSNPFWSSRNAHKDLSKQNSKQTETIEIVSDDEGDVSDVNSKESGPDSEDIDTNDSTYQERNVTSKQTRILSFLDDCSLEELAMIPGLSVKKANKLISLRPFESWDDMETKLKSSKALLSKKFLENTYHVLKKRDDVQNLMKRCERISKEVQMLLSAQLNEEMSQPTTLNPSCQLKPYQLTGLHWLKLMHDKKMNCILADEMGLGKTVQALSFIAHLIEEGDDGPYLIVAPASTLDNWVRELKHFYPSVSYISYYGSQEERSYLRHDIRSGDYQVIIATYQTAISTYQDRSLFRKLNIHYVVFDEGHMLKNMQSQRYQKLFNINAKRRLLLTGTPLQNDLMELMSLLCFVMPNMFGTLEISEGLNMLFSNKKSKESSSVRSYHEERLQQASSILKPFVLRRLKTDVLSQLPEKTENIVMVDLTAKQRSLYDKVFNECRQEFKKQKSSGLYGKNRNLVMPLRMTSNHPLLLRNNFDDSMLHEMAVKYCRDIANRGSEVELVYEDMTVMSDFELHRMCREYYNLQSFALTKEVLLDSGKFEYLKETLPSMKEKGDRVLLFSQFTLVMDVIEVFLNHHGYRFLRLDGGTKVSERQDLIDQFNNDKDIFIFLLSTRAGGLGINLTSANVVILHDIDFNPYNDKQAEDRCHRVGQTREVRIYKLVSKGTIEEAILNCAKSKLKLEQDVVKTQENDSCGFEETDDDVITVLGQTFRE